MLEARHIVKLQLDKARLSRHNLMPMPNHVRHDSVKRFVAIGDAVVGKLLDIDPTTFEMQLATAREHGASYIGVDKQDRPVGITAVASLIRDSNIMSKNVIVPLDLLQADPRLHSHYLVGVFLNNSQPMQGCAVDIAGWTTADEIKSIPNNTKPPGFETKLPVVMMPCRRLNPMPALYSRLAEVDGV